VSGSEIIITLHKEQQFTKVFEKLWQCEQRFIINKGGAGSSKSVSAAQKELLKSMDEKVRTLVIRKVGSTLKDSVIPSFRARISELGLSECFTENKTDRMMFNSATDSVFLFRGLDDAEKLKSIEGIDRILVEEATELTLDDFYELNRRARGREHIQITLNFNPVDERHWLKKHFFEQEIEDCVVIESTYEDNQFMTEQDVKQLGLLQKYDYNQYRIYALGDWGVARVDNPWLYAFDREKHISPTPLQLIRNQPVHLSFDFNINPLCCIAFQHTRYYTGQSYVHILKEFELRNTTVKEGCKIIKAAFPHSVLTATGDATGRMRNAGHSDTLWDQVRIGLGLSHSQILAPMSNLRHKDSRVLCNLLLQEHPSFLIDPSCKGLINDCLTARPIVTDDQEKEDKMLKGAGDSVLGFNLLDCFRYMVQTHHGAFGKR
jgi:phage terminase large subunit